jgi:hypothetical protein
MVPNNRIRRFWFDSSKLNPSADYPGRRDKENLRKDYSADRTCDSEGPDLFFSRFPDFTRSRRTPDSAYRTPQISEEAFAHAELHERLMARWRKRRGLWSKIWRFLWGD